MESRQVRRAEARHAAKVEAAIHRVRARKETRRAKSLSPLDRTAARGYPETIAREIPPLETTTEYFPHQGKRECARRVRQMEVRRG